MHEATPDSWVRDLPPAEYDIPFLGTIAWMTSESWCSVEPPFPEVWTLGPWGAKAWGRWAPLGFLQGKLHTHTHTHTHTHVNCHCHVLGQFPENKTKLPPGSPHPVLFENKHVIVYDVSYSSIGNELRVSNSFRMGHFIAEGSLGLWVLAKNHVSSSDRRQRAGAQGKVLCLVCAGRWRELRSPGVSICWTSGKSFSLPLSWALQL